MENFKEEFKVKGEEVIGKVKELLHEGNVRKLIIKDEDGKVYLEIPVRRNYCMKAMSGS